MHTFSPAKIKLTEYIDKLFDTLNESASINTINLHHEIEENMSVFADEKMLISILQNIVSNAIKHTGKGGTITVSAKSKDDKNKVLENVLDEMISEVDKFEKENYNGEIMNSEDLDSAIDDF
jgi:signal transduction histidine kinase